MLVIASLAHAKLLIKGSTPGVLWALQISRSDPVETEQAVLRLPPFPWDLASQFWWYETPTTASVYLWVLSSVAFAAAVLWFNL
jgi:hypothetical protein